MNEYLLATAYICAGITVIIIIIICVEEYINKPKPKKKPIDPAKRPGLKEYLEAVEHWFEMYEAYTECDAYERDGGYIVFYKNKKIFKRIGYNSRSCSYCKFCENVITKKVNCSICLLSGDKCIEEDSCYDDFAGSTTKKYAKNMLLYVINCKPKDYKETDEYFK